MSIVVDKINPNLLKTISEIAKKENKTETKVLEDIIEKGIKSKKNKIPDYLIGNKDTYNPDPDRIMKSGGFIKGVKPFNAVKLVREIRI
ncbi:MAG: hypothetical protein LBM96_02410 [Methanobrevibacter sp.]|jgi:hypothetical protein|nr:hypothetical protein [Candidatus Methanoflexus mossambicus]